MSFAMSSFHLFFGLPSGRVNIGFHLYIFFTSYSTTLSLTSALDGGGWSTPRSGRFTPEKDPVPIVQKAGLAAGTV